MTLPDVTLEDLLRAAAAKGLTHLTVYPVESADKKTIYWHARATPSSQHSYVHEIVADDIVGAMTAVLERMPAAKKRAAPKKGDVTVAVTEPPIDMDESAERLSRLATPPDEHPVEIPPSKVTDAQLAEDLSGLTNKPGEPLSGMPPGTDPLDLHDAFGDMDKWLPKT